MKKATLSK